MGKIVAIYRASIPSRRRRGAHDACPACGDSFTTERTVCEFCGGADFAASLFSGPNLPSRTEMRCASIVCPGYNRPMPYRTVVVNTSATVYCGPGQRVVVSRFLFFWRIRCREPSAHLHQSCRRCGWRGIVPPVEEDA